MTSEPDVTAGPVPQAPPVREDLPGPRCPAWLRRPALALIAGLAGLSYAWALLAAQTSALASVFIDDSGLEALPIGGFTGTIPSPTLAQLRADINAGRFHLVLAYNRDDPRLRWIAAHCRNLGPTTAKLHIYFCLPSGVG